jgi:hypothetical protein
MRASNEMSIMKNAQYDFVVVLLVILHEEHGTRTPRKSYVYIYI